MHGYLIKKCVASAIYEQYLSLFIIFKKSLKLYTMSFFTHASINFNKLSYHISNLKSSILFVSHKENKSKHTLYTKVYVARFLALKTDCSMITYKKEQICNLISWNIIASPVISDTLIFLLSFFFFEYNVRRFHLVFKRSFFTQ